jgi:hypothetical protein
MVVTGEKGDGSPSFPLSLQQPTRFSGLSDLPALGRSRLSLHLLKKIIYIRHCHGHTVTPPPTQRSRPFQPACGPQPRSEDPQSASVSSQLIPIALPIPNSPYSFPSLPSLPPFPVPTTSTVGPDYAQTRSRHLGSVQSSFAESSQMIAAAGSQVRSSPPRESQRSVVHPLVSLRPRLRAGTVAPAGWPELLSP